MELGCSLRIERVPTKDNLSDDPSRERYALLEKLQAGLPRRELRVTAQSLRMPQARWVQPYLYERFKDAQSWSSLVVTAHSAWEIHKEAVSKPNAITID